MTTAWSHVVRGEWLIASRCNLGGVMLAVTAIVAVPWSLVGAICGRVVVPVDSLAIAWGIVIILVTLTQWTIRMFG